MFSLFKFRWTAFVEAQLSGALEELKVANMEMTTWWGSLWRTAWMRRRQAGQNSRNTLWFWCDIDMNFCMFKLFPSMLRCVCSWSGTRHWCTPTRLPMTASLPSSSPWSLAPASRTGELAAPFFLDPHDLFFCFLDLSSVFIFCVVLVQYMVHHHHRCREGVYCDSRGAWL
jgi:hypothetical protein